LDELCGNIKAITIVFKNYISLIKNLSDQQILGVEIKDITVNARNDFLNISLKVDNKSSKSIACNFTFFVQIPKAWVGVLRISNVILINYFNIER
jgi:hypothetical protein